MKTSTTRNPKWGRLKRRLGNVPDYVVCGLLNMLWDLTADSAPHGNVGKFSNEDIAVHLGWAGDEDELVGLLVETGWLDECGTHRLVVHDWAEHAPKFIKDRLRRKGEQFASLAPQNANMSVSGASAALQNAETERQNHSESVSDAHKRNPTQRNPTEPNETQRNESGSFEFSGSGLWDQQPIGWIEFDWMAARQEFVRRWNSLPGGVVKSRLSDLPSDLASWFKERWSDREWRAVCCDAFAKMESENGLKSGHRLTLKRWLSEGSLADNVVGGTYDFLPGETRKGRNNAGGVFADDYAEGGANYVDEAAVRAGREGVPDYIPETAEGL